MLSLLAKFLKVLNSDAEPGQISLGFCFGMLMGFSPLMSLHNLLVLLMVLVIRCNLSAFMLSFGICSGIAYLIDPVFHKAGLAILTAEGLQQTWTNLYNQPVWRIARFNNTIVMGSVAIAMAAFIPLLLVSNLLIRKYREHFLEWVNKLQIMKAFKASSFYQLYEKAQGWGVVK